MCRGHHWLGKITPILMRIIYNYKMESWFDTGARETFNSCSNNFIFYFTNSLWYLLSFYIGGFIWNCVRFSRVYFIFWSWKLKPCYVTSAFYWLFFFPFLCLKVVQFSLVDGHELYGQNNITWPYVRFIPIQLKASYTKAFNGHQWNTNTDTDTILT